MAAVATPGFEDQPGGEDEANYSSDTESTSSSSSWMEEGDEGKRMVNETRRLLLLHQEHAMTLMELVDSFQTQEDPGNISVQILYRYLKTEAASKKFQVCFCVFKDSRGVEWSLVAKYMLCCNYQCVVSHAKKKKHPSRKSCKP